LNVLIDTNVVLDFVLKREPFADDANKLLAKLVTAKAKMWLTASTLTDIHYLSTRALKDAARAKLVVATLLNTFQIAAVDRSDCLNALEIDTDEYEDALVMVCAKRVKAERIVTRNLKHFELSPVPAVAPDEFLAQYFPEDAAD
jgi:predicted nucleic acid-binding protein